VISGDGSGEHFSVLDHRTHPGNEVALGDIDDDHIPADFHDQEITLFAVLDDDGHGAVVHNECDEDNNRVTLGAEQCRVLQ